jgi:SH3-like domain-containing protein
MSPRPLTILAALAALLTLAAPASAQADLVVPGEEHCVVNVRSDDVLNLRARPSSNAPILEGLRYGQCGVVVTDECRGNWCPVEDGHHAGWVHRRYISMVSPAMYCVAGVEDWDVLNLRAWPAATSRVLAELPPDQCGIAFLPYARDGWQKVRVDGWEGWVSRRYLSGQ